MLFQPIPILSIFLIVLLQFNLSNGSIFLPPPKEWKLTNLDELTRPTNSQVLNLNEQWRTWLLTQSTVTDLQFQQSLNLKLTHVERSTHALARQILTQFPTMILTGGYVRDIVINNEKGFTNQLDFYVPTNGNDGQPKTAIDDVAASIKQFGTKNNLMVASPVCVATTTKGRCTKLNVEVCVVSDGTALDSLNKCGDDATKKITIRLVVGAFEPVEFAANGLTLQAGGGVSTVDVDVLDVAKAANDVRNKILDQIIVGRKKKRTLRTTTFNEKFKRGVDNFLEQKEWNLSVTAHRNLGNCGAGKKHTASPSGGGGKSGCRRMNEKIKEGDRRELAQKLVPEACKRRLGTCSNCPSGQYQTSPSHTNTDCSLCRGVCGGTGKGAGTRETTACTLTTNRVCTQNVCSCSNGVAATGSACTIHNSNKCTSCSSGYSILSNACNANTCARTQVANSNKATTASISGTLN